MNELSPDHNSDDTQEYNWVISDAPQRLPESFLDQPLSEAAVETMKSRRFIDRARGVGKAVFEVVRVAFDGEAH